MTVETGLGEYLDKAVPLETAQVNNINVVAERPNHHLMANFANQQGVRFLACDGTLVETGRWEAVVASVGRPVDVGFECFTEDELR